MAADGFANGTGPLRIEKPVYGGDGLAHAPEGQVVFVPFVLPGEMARMQPAAEDQVSPAARVTARLVQILAPSPHRVEPACVHFGVCGGCQYQMAAYPAQLAMKQAILRETLERAGFGSGSSATGRSAGDLPGAKVWASPEEYGYRNRIRLRVQPLDLEIRLGYNVRGTNEFLPVRMCPIAAPLLWRAAEELVKAGRTNRDARAWLEAASEVELFCDAQEGRLQIALLCPGKAPRGGEGFARAMEAVRAQLPELSGAGASRPEVRSGRVLETYAAWGAAGIPYPVGEETYWVTRGGFFQVNRFLLPKLVELVCHGRSGTLAWDLFAGVGLFSRVLARSFAAVTAVEANPVASADLARALAKLGPQHRAVQATTLEFLRRAVLERDRPELIVLDPPRAGAGEEACSLLARLRPREIVYLSCDPATLARDLAVLAGTGYAVSELHLVDLFPQTFHIETLAVLRRA